MVVEREVLAQALFQLRNQHILVQVDVLALDRVPEPFNKHVIWRAAPAVHRVVSLVKRWLPGTHQDSFDEAHLVSYLNEFVFRSSRRRSRSRGMLFYRLLELAVAHEPVRYEDIVASRRPRKTPPVAPERRGHPASLERPAASRPWRATG